jgi:hypothetical protein
MDPMQYVYTNLIEKIRNSTTNMSGAGSFSGFYSASSENPTKKELLEDLEGVKERKVLAEMVITSDS